MEYVFAIDEICRSLKNSCRYLVVIAPATRAMVNIYERPWQLSSLAFSTYLRAFLISSKFMTRPKAYSMFFTAEYDFVISFEGVASLLVMEKWLSVNTLKKQFQSKILPQDIKLKHLMQGMV